MYLGDAALRRSVFSADEATQGQSAGCANRINSVVGRRLREHALICLGEVPEGTRHSAVLSTVQALEPRVLKLYLVFLFILLCFDTSFDITLCPNFCSSPFLPSIKNIIKRQQYNSAMCIVSLGGHVILLL